MADLASEGEASTRGGITFASIAAAMVFGTVVFLSMASAPIMLGALVGAGRLTNPSLGLVAMLETVGIAFGASVGLGFLRAGRPRGKVLAACVVLAGLNWACLSASGASELGGLRGACGVVEGLILAAANLILTYARKPERMSGWFLGITTVPQVVAAYVLPDFAIPRFGPNIGFELMAIAALGGAFAALAASMRHVPPKPARRAKARPWGPLAWAAMGAIVVQNAGIGAGYSYIVQIAKQLGVTDQVVGASMAGLQATAVVGAILVGAWAWRYSQMVVLTAGCALQAVVTLGLAHWNVPAAYLVGSCLFGMCWNALLPYSLKLLLELDASRGLGLMNGPMSLVGLGMGPLLAAAFVRGDDVAPAFSVAAALFLASGAAYLVINLASRASRAAGIDVGLQASKATPHV
jgi:hypothetical protein